MEEAISAAEYQKKESVKYFRSKVGNDFLLFFAMLHDRWQDEKKYEDFKDYLEALKKNAPDRIEVLKLTKSPFVCTANFMGGELLMKCTNTKLGWSVSV